MEIRSKVRMLLYENNSVVNEPQPANKATDVHAAKPSANNIFVFPAGTPLFRVFCTFYIFIYYFYYMFFSLGTPYKFIGKIIEYLKFPFVYGQAKSGNLVPQNIKVAPKFLSG